MCVKSLSFVILNHSVAKILLATWQASTTMRKAIAEISIFLNPINQDDLHC